MSECDRIYNKFWSPHDGYYAGKIFQPMCPRHVVLRLLALMNTSTDVSNSNRCPGARRIKMIADRNRQTPFSGKTKLIGERTLADLHVVETVCVG